MSDPTSKIRGAQLQLKKLIPEDLYPALECSPNSKKPADLEKIKAHRGQVATIAKRLAKSSGLDEKTKKKRLIFARKHQEKNSQKWQAYLQGVADLKDRFQIQ